MTKVKKSVVVPSNTLGQRKTESERTSKARVLQALELQRENILNQSTSNPGRRAALQTALEHIEAQMQEHSLS